jgi:hypothetical protein
MPVEWRPPGGGMGTVNIGELGGDQIVIHFGGALTSVDAYTFGNSLIAFADTVRAVNAVLNPDQNIELRVEAIGPGSFRAVVKRLKKGLGGFFGRGVEAVFWGIVATLIYENLIKHEPHTTIKVEPDEVIIEKNGDRIIIPRSVYDQMPPVRNNPEVQRHLSRTFQVIEEDPAIENFGLTHDLKDKKPPVQITRAEFPYLAAPEPLALEAENKERHRVRTERARLVILKAWLVPGNRKWSFEWNGVPLSAPIADESFFERLAAREVLIGQGDALDVELTYEQNYDDTLGVFVNDPHTFRITKVFAPVPRLRQLRLPDNHQ